MNPKVRLYDFNVYDKDNKDNQDLIDEEDEEDKKDFGNKKQFMIQMFGMDEAGNDYSILVDNYNPFFYVLINKDKVGKNEKNEIIEFIRKKMGKWYANDLLDTHCRLRKKKKDATTN